jgi:hypothetical protein
MAAAADVMVPAAADAMVPMSVDSWGVGQVLDQSMDKFRTGQCLS